MPGTGKMLTAAKCSSAEQKDYLGGSCLGPRSPGLPLCCAPDLLCEAAGLSQLCQRDDEDTAVSVGFTGKKLVRDLVFDTCGQVYLS